MYVFEIFKNTLLDQIKSKPQSINTIEIYKDKSIIMRETRNVFRKIWNAEGIG
jgi:hypothetical protein